MAPSRHAATYCPPPYATAHVSDAVLVVTPVGDNLEFVELKAVVGGYAVAECSSR